MEAKEAAMGGSLQVPSVQELAKEPLTAVPSRYVRSLQDLPYISDNSPPPPLPVVDLQNLFSEESVGSELDKFHSACRDWGFFQLINHGVSLSLVENLKLEVENFFHLPLNEKKKYYQKAGDVEGFGQAFVVSEEQKLDWADMFFITTLPVHSRKQHLFPVLPLPLRETLESYSAEMKDLAMKLISLMAKALRMEAREMTQVFEEGTQSMRMNYYPPCPQPELVMGLNAHSDAGGLTILLQLNQMEGLQIKKDGKWVSIKPLPNAFIINIGDALEILTNGMYQSIEHRATVNSVKERLSIATFYSPGLEGELGPAPSLVTSQTPPLFSRIRFEDYLKGYFSRQLDGKSYLDVIRIRK